MSVQPQGRDRGRHKIVARARRERSLLQAVHQCWAEEAHPPDVGTVFLTEAQKVSALSAIAVSTVHLGAPRRTCMGAVGVLMNAVLLDIAICRLIRAGTTSRFR